MVKTGFHYLNENTWKELNDEKNDFESLQPRRRLIPLHCICDTDIPKLPAWAHEGYIFAFPDSTGQECWKNYRHFEEELEILMKDIRGSNRNLLDDWKVKKKILCFTFDILPDDDAYVVDRVHFADWQWEHNPNKKDAYKKYAFSRIRANKYNGDYLMPELIIRNPISLDRLILHDEF